MRQDSKKKKAKKKSRAPLAALVILLLLAGSAAAYVLLLGNPLAPQEPEDTRPINPLTGLRVTSLPERVVQVSIDNVECIPQSGLSKADIIYEFPAEGGPTRLQAIFYAETPDVVGPIRSARPYFIDLAREYNAVFLHHGGSPAAFEYLDTGVVDDISPNTNYKIFYRESTRYAPHNSMVHFQDVWGVIRDRGVDTVQAPRTFTFVPEDYWEQLVASLEDGEELPAPTVTEITVDNPYTLVEYKYNAETHLYDHYVDGELYYDLENDEPITSANILIQFVTSNILDKKGRREIDMTAGGEAWLFTRGEVIKGTWARADLDSPTIFTDAEGNEFVLSRGKTFVHVSDQNTDVTYQ